MTLHPEPAVNINTITCPVCGRLRFGATLTRVNQLRQQALDDFNEDPSIPDGTPVDMFQQSPTCGTVKLHFVKGTNDQDGLPSILAVSLEGLDVPCRGTRRLVNKKSDQGGVDSNPTDVSELAIPVLAGEQIRFRAVLGITTSAAAIGAMVACNGPAVSLVAYETREWTSPSAQSFNTQTALDTYSSQTTGNGSALRFYIVEGVALFTADGTFVPRVKAESGGTLTVFRGSFMEYDLI